MAEPPDIPANKTYEFGELNDVAPSRVQRRLSTQNNDPIRAMRDAAIDLYTPNALEGMGPYKGIVIRVMEDPDPNDLPPGDWLYNLFGIGDTPSPPAVLKRYKVRIPELHAMVPVPTEYQMGPDASTPPEVVKIVARYPTFLARDSNVPEASCGDLVWVDFGHRINQSDPVFLGPLFPPPESGGGGAASTRPHNGPCGGLGGGGGGGGGGALTPDQRDRLVASGENFGCAIYLSTSPRGGEIKRRNERSPTRRVGGGSSYYRTVGSRNAKTPEYVEAGGSQLARSGRMAKGSCASISSRLARICKAHTIVCEDYSDRGYQLGARALNGTAGPIAGARPGGIDCSGFTFAVRVLSEWLCSANGQYYGFTNRVDSAKPWYAEAGPYTGWYHAKSRGELGQPEGKWSGRHTNVMVATGKTTDQLALWNSTEVPPMPGDEILVTVRPRDRANRMDNGTPPRRKFWSGRKWYWGEQNKEHFICHVLIAFVDPEGHLRLAESGGTHAGVGSKRWEVWSDGRMNREHYCFQSDEMKQAWQEAGGRPTTPWTPAMAREKIPEFFNASLDSRAAGTTPTATPATDGATNSDGETPSIQHGETPPATPPAAGDSATPPADPAGTPPTDGAQPAGPPTAAQQAQAEAREQLPAKTAAYEEKRNVLKPATSWTDGQERSEAALDTLLKKDENCPSAASTNFTPPLATGLKAESTTAWNEACTAWCDLKTTEAAAGGQNANTPANQSGSGQPAPAATGGDCRSGQGGGGGGAGRGRPLPPRPPAQPPATSVKKDAEHLSWIHYSLFGFLDQNAKTRRRGYEFIVIHDGGAYPYTADWRPKLDAGEGKGVIGYSSAKGCCKDWLSRSRCVGSHYYICSNGNTFQLGEERLVWCHAGCGSCGKDRTIRSLNSRSIGIDLQSTGSTTAAQMESLNKLIKDICRRRSIPNNETGVIAHFQSPKKHHYDPYKAHPPAAGSGFDWSKLKKSGGTHYDHTVRDPAKKVPGLWTDDDAPAPAADAPAEPASGSSDSSTPDSS